MNLSPTPIPDNFIDKWQATLNVMARIFDVPSALLMRVWPRQIEFFLTSQSQGNPFQRGQRAPLNTGLYCEAVMSGRGLIHVTNAREDPEWDHNPLLAQDMIAYLGLPLYWDASQLFGTICVLDTRAREHSANYIDLLSEFKGHIEADLALIRQRLALETAHLELEQARQEADRRRTEAEQQSQRKSQFIASAVHDLRQPIQAIGNTLEPLREAVRNGDRIGSLNLLDLASEATTMMRGQLGAILEISRLESGMVRPEVEPVDLHDLIESVLQQMDGTAAGLGVRLEWVPPSGCPRHVLSDRQLLLRVLANLVGNGIKYHNRRQATTPSVRIELREAGESLVLAVADNGIGIDEAHLRDGSIFEPYVQLHRPSHDGDKGVGLGLSIVRAMLSLLPAHSLQVESVLGQGSTFSLSLPVAKSHQVTKTVTTDLASEPMDAVNLRGAYVLLVDDNLGVRRSMAALLEGRGMRTESVATLGELDALLPQLERLPDLVLSDFYLGDGKTAVDVLMAVETALGPLPFLILTADSFSPRTAGLELHWPVLHKPISSEDLLRAISEVLRARLAR